MGSLPKSAHMGGSLATRKISFDNPYTKMSQPLMVSGTIPAPESNPRSRWLYLDNFLRHAGPFSDEDFETSEEAATNIERMNILVMLVALTLLEQDGC